jgi:hypothetical protein
MTPGWEAFRAVWTLDFEFVALPGERPDPVCMVGHELKSGRTVRLFRDELRACRESPIPTGPDVLHVTFFGSAEWGCYLALGWPIPSRIVDLFAEFRLRTNFALSKAERAELLPRGNGLLGAAAFFGIDAMDTAEKEANRALIMDGGPWTAETRARVLNYCESDVITTARLFQAMAPGIDVSRALIRGRYTAAVAHMERRGVPIDVATFDRLRDRWNEIKLEIVRADDRFGVFDGASFKEDRFNTFLVERGLWWPRFPSGRPVLDDDTFKAMVRFYPELARIRKIRQTLAETRLFDNLAVGRDGRNRTLLSPFATSTGRNAPSNARFVFGPSAWARGLIQPEPGMALAYVDYTAQEFAIAGYLSGDRAMIDAYESGRDVYLAFGARAGVVPPDATKETHGPERKLLKAAVLGSQYGLGPDGLAHQIGRSRGEARDLLEACRRASPDYWRWSAGAVRLAMATGQLHTCLGWATIVRPETRPTSLLNWPIQAHAAEMLRLACCMLTERGIRVCAPVHDAVLVEAPDDRIDAVAAETQAVLTEASEIILGGPTLRSDAQVVRFPDRLLDDDSRAFWGRLMGYLDAPARAEAEIGTEIGPGVRLGTVG